ncbi:UNVERIFIED_ORG: hypothetical protein BDK47_10252 [Anoxybacillus amylolyticus]
MEELLRQLTTLVQGLVDDMSVLKQDMQTVKQKLGQLEQRVDKLEQRMDKQEEELRWLKEQMKENTEMIKVIRDNQLEQRSIQDGMCHEIASLRGEMAGIREQMATKEDISLIHQRLDYQLGRIARVEEEMHLLKKAE